MASPVQNVVALLQAWADTIKKHYVPGIYDRVMRHGKTTRLIEMRERAVDGIKIEYEVARFPNRGTRPSMDLMSAAPGHSPGAFGRFVLNFDHTDAANNDFLKQEIGLSTTYWDLKKKADSNFKGGGDFIARDVQQAVDDVKESVARSIHLPTTGLIGTVATSGKKRDDNFIFGSASAYVAGDAKCSLQLGATAMAHLAEGQIIDIYTSGGSLAIGNARITWVNPVDFVIHVEVISSGTGGTVVSTAANFDAVGNASTIYVAGSKDAVPKGNLAWLFNPTSSAGYFRDQNGTAINRNLPQHKYLYPHRIANAGSAALLTETALRAAGTLVAFRQGDGNAKVSRMMVMNQDGYNNFMKMQNGLPAGGSSPTAHTINRFIPAVESQIGGELKAAFGFDGFVWHDPTLGSVMAVVDDFAQYGYIRILDRNDWEITVPSVGGFDFLPGPLGGIWHNMDEVSGSSAPSLRFAARGLMAYAFVCTAPNQQVEIYNILTTA